jgi:hypothetical protein
MQVGALVMGQLTTNWRLEAPNMIEHGEHQELFTGLVQDL